jgi:glycosyltransferase involved in cell wall biosynthesis
MSARRTLLHLTPLAAIGGCEVNCLRIIEARPECDHRVLVFGHPGPMSERWRAAGAAVEHLATWETGLTRFKSSLVAWEKGQADPDGVLYWSNSRLPWVLEILSNWPVPWIVYLGNPLDRRWAPRLRQGINAWRRGRPGRVTLVACSEHVARSHRTSVYYRRFPMTVVYNAVDPALDRQRRHRALEKGSPPRVGMVARLDRVKDHLTAIRGLAAATPLRNDIILEFAGDGDLREELEQEVTRLKVESRVRFLGFQAVDKLLAEWDIYLHSTTPAEGMGTAVAEAMLAGLPCLVTDIGVMREVCGADGAVYAPPGDADMLAHGLVRLVRDRSWRATLGQAAQERARKLFGRKETAAAYCHILFPPGEADLA